MVRKNSPGFIRTEDSEEEEKMVKKRKLQRLYWNGISSTGEPYQDQEAAMSEEVEYLREQGYIIIKKNGRYYLESDGCYLGLPHDSGFHY